MNHKFHDERGASGERMSAAVTHRPELRESMKSAGFYDVVCYPAMRDAKGNVIYKDAWSAPVLRSPEVLLLISVISFLTCGLLRISRSRVEKLRVPVPDMAHPKWRECVPNKIVDAGLTYGNGTKLASVTQITAWFLFLKGTGTVAAADTMASHSGWSEITPYSDATRIAFTAAAGAAGVVSNSAAPASFTINGSSTLFGAGLVSNSTKGGTTGTLYSVADFSSSRAVVSTDTVLVTATFTDTSST